MTSPHTDPAPAALAEVIAVTHITTKQDMSRWTRAHADAPGINWTVKAGPGGTLLVIEHAHDRATLAQAEARPPLRAAG